MLLMAAVMMLGMGEHNWPIGTGNNLFSLSNNTGRRTLLQYVLQFKAPSERAKMLIQLQLSFRFNRN